MSDELTTELVHVTDLTPDPTNARKHSSRNVQAIANSLRAFGQRRPLLVSTDGVVMAGNGTLEAAKSLGWKQISVSRLPEDWDYAQMRAFALADNRTAELAAWDEDILVDTLDAIGDSWQEAAGWNAQELDRLLGADLYEDRKGTDDPKEDSDGWGEEAVVKVGSFRFQISRDKYEEWVSEVRGSAGYSDQDVIAEIMRRLGL